MYNKILSSIDSVKKLNRHICNTPNALIMLMIISALVTGSIISWYAKIQIDNPVTFYDIDGWGHVVRAMQESDSPVDALKHSYHPHRGTFVPFLFGLSYLIFRIPESIQILNIIFQTASVIMLILIFTKFWKMPILGAGIGIIWSAWPHFRHLYGYYFSEPVAGFFYMLSWFLILKMLYRTNIKNAIFAGGILGLTIQIKPSAVLAISGIFLFLLIYFSRSNLKKNLAIFFISFLVIYSFMPISNYLKFKTLIPFTLQGSKVLHQGTFIPGDDMPTEHQRTIKEYNKIEAKENGMSDLEKYQYYQKLALEQIFQNPIAQLKLIPKKFLRFWFYVSEYSYLPSLKTFILMTPLLLAFFYGFARNYSSRKNIISFCLLTGVWVFHGIIHSEFRYQFYVLPILLYFSFLGFSQLGPSIFIRERGKRL